MKRFLNSELEVEEANPAWQTSTEARYDKFATCCKGDVVLVDCGDCVQAGEVWFRASYDIFCLSLVSLWTFRKVDRTIGAAEWLEERSPIIVETCDILSTLTYTRCHGGIVRTLIPFHLRNRL